MTDTAVPRDLAGDLLEAFAARDAEIVRVELDPPKTYLWARSLAGELFAWHSTDPLGEGTVDYEVAARAAVGTEGRLRALPILARGRTWRLEPAVDGPPLIGRSAVEAAAAAAAELAELELPPTPPSVGQEGMAVKLARRLRVLRSPLPAADFVRARRILVASRLPLTTSHGNFHRKHLLYADGVPWIVDWELAAKRPAGYDLMTLWNDLQDEADRRLLFDLCVEMVGAEHREGLLKLRYALLVQIIAALVSERAAWNRDLAGARALLALLPSARADAGGD